MFKRMISLLLILSLLPVIPVLAADNGFALPGLDELNEFAARAMEMARKSVPVNDPHDPQALTEDGYAFIYDFATLYMDRPELDEKSVLKGFVITEDTRLDFRGIILDSSLDALLTACGCANTDLKGTEEGAVTSVEGSLPGEIRFGLARRDGQQIQSVEYTVHAPVEDGYTDTGITFALQSRLVTAIRVYGLGSVLSANEAEAESADILSLSTEDSYRQVPFSYDGTELEPFGPEDLIFSGIDFLHCTPESLGTPLEEDWIEDEDAGIWLYTAEYIGFTATFAADADKEEPKLVNLDITGERPEGPRCIRIGDPLHEILNRFRNEDALKTEEGWVLYGTPGIGSWGLAEYGDDASAVLRYCYTMENGSPVELVLWFTMLELTGITVSRNVTD